MPEISTIAGVPRSNAYDALEKMMSKGICVSKPGNTKRYSASPPDLLRETLLMNLDEETESELQKLKRDQSTALKKKEQEMLQRKKAAEADITQVMRDLQPEYEKSRKQTDPLDYIEIIKGGYQIHRRFLELIADAQQEIMGFTKPPYTVPREKLREEQVDPQLEALKRGVRNRSIYEMPKDEDERRFLFLHGDRSVQLGAEIRVLEELPMKMIIFDSKIVLTILEDALSGETSLTAQVVEHPALAKSLKILFETLWEQAQDYHVLKD